MTRRMRDYVLPAIATACMAAILSREPARWFDLLVGTVYGFGMGSFATACALDAMRRSRR